MNNTPDIQSIQIDNRLIGAGSSPYVIAELSANHNGAIENALALIENAAQAGADAIKLQTYTADTLTLNCDTEDFRIHGGPWDGKTLYQLYQEAYTPWDWHDELFGHAEKLGITIFSSPFDPTAVDFLENLNCPAYKIASFEAVDLALIRYAASTGKPLIISTGMSEVDEIKESIETAREAGCKDLAILHCVSGYPAPAADYNLRTIPHMISQFGVITGLSDHTLGTATAITSIALGASIIEKHLTLDRNRGGPDDSFSLEPSEFKSLCMGVRDAWASLGSVDYSRKSSEAKNMQFRRSLYFVKDLNAGDKITEDVIRSVRPGFGLPPKYLATVLGRTLTRSVKANTPVHWDEINGEATI